jgi:aspartyl-tRNA(Asn)/glutamyl-tRNA(Gln) amidotransferase subunit B
MASKQILSGMIGLEIHTYLVTKEKLFCKCKASREKGLVANTLICPICTGQPGAKPMMPNGEAVKQAVKIGLMLGCTISENMPWKRKHYSWPDLPKGYQNTLSGSGAIPLGTRGKFLGIKIGSMHLEEDPAAWNPKTGEVDYNRSGLPLVEIVTDPDFSTAEEVKDWLKKLVHALSYLKAVDSNAGIKVDVNVSIPGKSKRVEVKNVSSIESIGRAIDFEFARQKKEGGKQVETRRWDDNKGKSEVMRSKEGGADYRFISDPDLVDLQLSKSLVSGLEKGMPEKPEEKLKKLVKKHKIGKKDAEVLAKNIDVVEFFEKVSEKVDPIFSLHWVSGELLRFLNYNKKMLHEVSIEVDHFAELLKLVKSGKITKLKGKEILNDFHPKSFMPKADDVKQISDSGELGKIIDKVLASNKKAVDDYKNGEGNSLNFLIGQVMKASGKRADFKVVRELLEESLK